MVEIDEKQGFAIIQKAKETGKIKIGINEVTKSIERGVAKAVFYANDVSPAEIVAHLPELSKEMNILCFSIGSKEELGASIGIKSTTAIAIIDSGSAKSEIENLILENNSVEKKEESKQKESKVQDDESSKEKKEELSE